MPGPSSMLWWPCATLFGLKIGGKQKLKPWHFKEIQHIAISTEVFSLYFMLDGVKIFCKCALCCV